MTSKQNEKSFLDREFPPLFADYPWPDETEEEILHISDEPMTGTPTGISLIASSCPQTPDPKREKNP